MARKRIMGLPIGRKRTSPFEVAKKAGTAAAVMAAPALAAPLARRVGSLTRGARQTVQRGQDLAGTASEVMDTASRAKEAVSSHSSTIGKVGGLVSALAGGGKSSGGGGGKPKLAHLIEQHTDIAAPRSVVYNQWTQLEMFPTLTKGIESVDQEDDERSHWTSKIGPSRRSWTGRVVEQTPDERIVWTSEGGASIQGVVTFHSLDEDLTRVLLEMEYKPTGPVEWVGNTLRIQRRRAKRDLRLFKHFVEMRGEETGAWRGKIDRESPLEPKFSGQTPAGKGSQGKDDGKDKDGDNADSGDDGDKSPRGSRQRSQGGGRSRQGGGRPRQGGGRARQGGGGEDKGDKSRQSVGARR